MGEINSLIVHLEEITKRPKSLPPDINIFHLWKSLQVNSALFGILFLLFVPKKCLLTLRVCFPQRMS